MIKKPQVLLFDGSAYTGNGLAMLGELAGLIDVWDETQLRPYTEDLCVEGFLEEIRDLTSLETCQVCDLAILGNNMGRGIRVGYFINEKIRSKTVVVYHDTLEPRDKERYLALGYKQFMTRNELAAGIKQMLGLK